MTRDDIIRIAHEAGLHLATDVKWMPIIGLEYAEKFAALIAASEREACAKVCDKQGKGRKALEHYAALTYAGATNDCAAAIRARG